MLQDLHRHPDTPCEAVAGIEVEVVRNDPRRLSLRYRIVGDAAGVELPAPAAAARTDELWRRTCFEAFIRPDVGEAYREFNFSPSSQWAAYAFEAYRQGMQPLDGIGDPRVRLAMAPDGFEVLVDLDAGPGITDGARLGLSAVIREAGGRVSYWALAFPPGKPDFHHADCFAALLPGTMGS